MQPLIEQAAKLHQLLSCILIKINHPQQEGSHEKIIFDVITLLTGSGKTAKATGNNRTGYTLHTAIVYFK